MVDITYSLQGANNEVVVFDDVNFVINPGLSGFGIAPTEVRIDPSASIGGRFRHSRRGVRDLDLPVTVIGDDRLEVQTNMRKLARVTQDARGPMRLKAQYSTGEQLFLDLHYTGGAEAEWGDAAGGRTWQRLVLSCQAPQPFWESTETESFDLSRGGTGRGLLPQLSKLRLASSQALGEVLVVSTADVEVFPVWTITGPVTDFSVSDGENAFTVSGAISASETVTVDTQQKTVVDGTGANLYARLGPAPKLFSFQPGETLLTSTGTNANADTLVVVEYALRFEVVH